MEGRGWEKVRSQFYMHDDGLSLVYGDVAGSDPILKVTERLLQVYVVGEFLLV